MEKLLFDSDPIIHTTGAFLRPMKVPDSEGKEIWLWFVSEFNEDTFKDGKVYNPKEFGKTKAELLVDTTAELFET
ncbi:MAG: hypothetical protein HY707_05680 [Ignavibacteriae bacterium]|nr:hypothetical protein [Ignavibacteriota bacterium]